MDIFLFAYPIYYKLEYFTTHGSNLKLDAIFLLINVFITLIKSINYHFQIVNNLLQNFFIIIMYFLFLCTVSVVKNPIVL